MANPFGDAEVPATSANPFGDTEVVEANPFGDEEVSAKPILRATAQLTPEEQEARKDATYMGAHAETLKQVPFVAAGAGMEAAGDLLSSAETTREQRRAAVAERIGGKFERGEYLTGALDVLTEPVNAARQLVGQLGAQYLPEGVKEFGRTLSGAGAELADESVRQVQAATPTDMNMLQEAGLSITRSAAMALPALIAARYGVLSPEQASRMALSVMGSDTFLTSYNQAKAAGKDDATATQLALPNAMIEVATEKWGMDDLLTGGAGWFKKFALKEIGGEEIATVGQSMMEKTVVDPTKWSTASEIGHDLAVTALAAGGTVGVMKGADYAIGKTLGDKAVEVTLAEQEIAAVVQETERRLQAALIKEQTGKEPSEQELAHQKATAILGDLLNEPLTPAEEAQANLLKAQMAGEITEPGTEEAQAFGAALDAALMPTVEEVRANYLATDGATPDVGGMFPETLAKQQLEGEDAPAPLPLSQKQIAYSVTADAANAQDVEGLTLSQTGLPGAGSVTVLKGDDRQFPPSAVKVIADTVQGMFQKYMPDARVVLNLDPLNAGVTTNAKGEQIDSPTGTFGWHNMVTIGGETVHVINPLQFPTVKHGGGNVHSMMNVIGALSHEVGHAIKLGSLQKNLTSLVGADLTNAALKEVKAGDISDETLAALEAGAGVNARMFREWRDLKRGVLDGTLTANDLSDRWLGIRKLGDSMKRQEQNQEARSWTRRVLAPKGKNIENSTALDVVKAVTSGSSADVNRWLSFDEYMAEQFSRHAYTSGDITTSLFGRWFTATMEKMRALFRTLKMEKMIAPSTTFQEWIEEASVMNRASREAASPKFKLSKKLMAQRDKARGVAAQMKELEAELAAEKVEAEAQAKAAAEQAAKVKADAVAKASAKKTRTKKDVQKAQVVAKVAPAEISVMALMVEVQKLNLAERKKVLAGFPEDATGDATYQAIRQMLQDAVAELETKPAKARGRTRKGAEVDPAAVVAEIATAPAAKPKATRKKKATGKEVIETPVTEEQPVLEAVTEDLGAEAVITDDEGNVIGEMPAAKGGRKKLSSGKAALTKRLTKADAALEKEQTRLRGMLETAAFLLTDKKVQSITDQIDKGQLKAAEAALNKVLNDESNYDREYTSSVLRKMPSSKEIGLRHFQDILGQQGVKAKEVQFWKTWAMTGTPITEEGMKAALAAVDVPLVPRVYSHDTPLKHGSEWLIDNGWRALGFDTNVTEPQMTVWGTPSGYELPRSNHFGLDNYVMHSRWVRDGAVRYLAEVQSQALQTGKGLDFTAIAYGDTGRLNAQLRGLQGRWMEDIVQNEVIQSFYEGDVALRFPTGQTFETLSGWHQARLHPLARQAANYAGMSVGEIKIKVAEDYAKMISKVKDSMDFDWADKLENNSTNWLNSQMGNASELSDAKQMQVALAMQYRDLRDAGIVPDMIDGVVVGQRFEERWMDSVYNMYNKEMRDFLTKRYKAVSVVDSNGNTWLEVNPQEYGDSKTLFDRENPVHSVTLPGVSLERHVGLWGATVEEGQAQWEANGLSSPFFKRWFGQSKVVNADGTPQGVWRGVGGWITYVANSQARQTQTVHWFSDIPSEQYGLNTPRTTDDGVAQRLSKAYLVMENPLEVSADGREVPRKELNSLVARAMAAGHDGLIVRNLMVNDISDHFATWDLGNVALESEGAVADEVNQVHWDRTESGERAKEMATSLAKIPGIIQNSWLHNWHRLEDGIVQLHQRAWTSQGQVDANGKPVAGFLEDFVNKLRSAREYKNSLQVEAEKFVHRQLQPHVFTSQARVQWLEKMLRFEATEKGDNPPELFGTVRYYGAPQPNGDLTLLNPNAERMTPQMLVEAVEVQIELTPRDLEKVMAWAKEAGVPASIINSPEFKQLYEKARTIMAQQFLKLGQTMVMQAETKYQQAPLLMRRDILQSTEVIAHLIHVPFTPQGNFGKYVVMVKQKIEPASFGPGPHYRTIRREHFESKADYEKTATEWKMKAQANPGLKVTTKELSDDDLQGLPMQLPFAMLERISEAGVFTEDQMELLGELMTSGKVDRVANRFARLGKVYEGTSTNFARTFADFTWRNSNYIWKQHYNTTLKETLKAARGEIRGIERDNEIEPGLQTAMIDQKRRNLALMENTLKYLMNPPNEWQGLRSKVTLLYLWGSLKTAVMNLSTMGNTVVAAQARAGEWGGSKAFLKAVADASWALQYKYRGEQFQLDTLLQNDPKRMELVKLMELATQQGVIDQSYAYYLAGYANQNMSNHLTSVPSSMFHTLAEYGMAPFQAFELTNRVVTLITMHQLARAEGKNFDEAYNEAVAEVDTLQNSYSAENRSPVMRGWKSVITMFMSYPQFMGWFMTGKYEKGARAKATAEGRSYAPAWRGPTAKLWVFYLFMAGLMGVPFAKNLMDIMQILARKLWGINLDSELREFIRSYGMDSNMVMNGRLHSLFGFDLSGSFGLGRLIPGTDFASKRAETGVEVIGNAAAAMTGPFGGAVKSSIEALIAIGETGSLLEGAKKMPGATGYVSNTLDIALRQRLKPDEGWGVVAKDGTRLIWDEDTKTFRDVTTNELFFNALGFNPTVKSVGQEKYYAGKREQAYWSGRRSDLVSRFVDAKQMGDLKWRDAIKADIDDYNNGVPSPKLRITGKDLGTAYRTAEQQRRAAEKHGTTSKKYRQTVQDIREEY